MEPLAIQIEHVATPTEDARRLIGELDAELNAHYAAVQRHGLDFARIFQPGILFYIAQVEGTPAGCGGVAIADGWAELKRMYVRPAVRGRGVARAIIARLEAEAAARGIRRMVLETGDAQLAAIRCYERAGYRRCGPFGQYTTMPSAATAHSVFLEKHLA